MTKIYIAEAPVEGVFRLGREHKKRLVKVMRLNIGDPLLVLSAGQRWECRVQSVLPDGIHLAIIRELLAPPRKLHLILAQAIPKGERFEWLIQKATELGVAEIYPLITERTIVKPAHIAAKLQRWNEIAEQAAGQSENEFPCIIHKPQSLPSFWNDPINSKLKLLLHERKDSLPLRKILEVRRDCDRITVVVGPEGGWTDAETEEWIARDYRLVHLGPRILRSETSGLVMATLLQYELGDLQTAQQLPF